MENKTIVQIHTKFKLMRRILRRPENQGGEYADVLQILEEKSVYCACENKMQFLSPYESVSDKSDQEMYCQKCKRPIRSAVWKNEEI